MANLQNLRGCTLLEKEREQNDTKRVTVRFNKETKDDTRDLADRQGECIRSTPEKVSKIAHIDFAPQVLLAGCLERKTICWRDRVAETRGLVTYMRSDG